MNKKILLLSALFILPIVSNAACSSSDTICNLEANSRFTSEGKSNITNNILVVEGSLTANNIGFQNLTVQDGPLSLSYVDLKSLVFQAGKVSKAKNASFNTNTLKAVTLDNLTSFGITFLDTVTVKYNANIQGKLDAVNSTFKGNLILDSGDMSLANSTINNIIVKAPANNVQQDLYLKNNTVVKGDITFESGKGVVHLSNGSKLKGKIKGGMIAD